MNNFLGMDSPLINFLNRAADIVILNVLFILCSIPVITIGASCTALYSITLKMVKGEEAYAAKGFFTAFKSNFKQSTLIWIFVMLLILLLGADFYIIGYLPASTAKILYILLTGVSILCLMVVLYLFPYIARFYNKTLACVKNALYISILNFPYTLLLLFLTLGLFFITFYNINTMGKSIIVWLLGGFALYAFVTSFLFRHIFSKYEQNEEEDSLIELK